jgi:acetyl-CoA synthetase
LAVPKAYVTLAGAHEPTRETALSIMRFAREQLAPYKRIRRLEFAALPKTISGKIRRVELRTEEHARHPGDAPPSGRADQEFWEEDFPELKG